MVNRSLQRVRAISMLFVLGLCGGWISLAQANDLQIVSNSLQISYTLNGSAYTPSGFLPYQEASDTLSSDIELAISWGCNGTLPDFTCVSKPASVTVTLQAVSFTVNVLGENIESVFDLGDYVAGASDIRYRDCSGGCFFETQLITFSQVLSGMTSASTSFEAWAAEAYDNGYFRRLRVHINRDAVVPEDNIDNNQANYAGAVPAFFPMAGELFFGNVETKLLLPYDLINTTCPGSQLRYSGDLTWLPSSNGQWPEVGVPGVDICVSHLINGNADAFELHAEEYTTAYSVSGVHGGGMGVTIPFLNLTPTGILPSGKLAMPLPSGLSYHEKSSVGSPVPRGYRNLPMSLTEIVIDDLSQLQATHTGGFLFSRKLPFSVEIGTLTLDEVALAGSFVGTHYNQLRQLHISDPRHSDSNPGLVNGLVSNDLRFSESLPPADSQLSITPEGVDLTSDFSAAWGRTHFPATVNQWESFSANVENSALEDHQALAGRNGYYFVMSPDCAQCGSRGVALNYYPLNEVDTAGMSSDGAIGMFAEIPIDPQWGPWDEGLSRSIFRRTGDENKTGVFYMPGFQAVGSGGSSDIPVTGYLLGSRRGLRDSTHLIPTEHFSLHSYAARQGNYFMPGFTIGPEFYSTGSDKQPLVGLGTDMAGSGTNIGFGGVNDPDYVPTGTGVAAKYVVRRSGLSGVFNSETIPQPYVYEYELALDRFAFRQINNDIDPYTWIDGSIQVGGKGDFNIAFSSLSLECSGNVGGGVVVRETCNDSIDNNNNGLTDENCSERLKAWNAPIDLLSMRFEADSNAGMCDAQTRELVVGNSVEFNALDALLGLRAHWSTAGDPSQVVISGDTDHVLDRPESPASSKDDTGFAIALKQNIELKTPGTSNENGWVSMDGTLGIPFWNSLDVSTRIANASPSGAAQSIVMPRGGDLFGSIAQDDQKTNAEMAAKLKDKGELGAEYAWGLTGFTLSLPVYYETGNMGRNRRPEFLGIAQSRELVVMDVDSGINYIDPARTKMSFGASSDFEALAELEIDLHIDLSDPDSVANIDDFLCSTLSIAGCPANGPIAGLIDDTLSKMNLLNVVADAGLDTFLERGVRNALPVTPFNEMAEIVGQLQALPEQVALTISSGLNDLTNQLLDPLSSELDVRAKDIFNRLPGLIVQINLDPNSVAARDGLEDIEVQLEQLIAEIDKLRQPLNAASAAVAHTRDEIDGFVTDTLVWVDQASDAIDAVTSSLTVLDSVCTIAPDQRSSSNKLLNPLVLAKNRLEDAIDAINIVQLEQFSGLLASVSGIDLSAVSNAQNNIQRLTGELQMRLDQGMDEFAEQLCGGGSSLIISDALDGALQLLGDVKGLMSQADPRITTLRRMLNEDKDLDNVADGGYLADVDAGLDSANDLVVNIQTVLHTLILDIRKELAGEVTGYSGMLETQISDQLNDLIFDITLDAFEWVDTSENSFIGKLGDELRAPIDNAIASATARSSNLLSALGIWVPYQTGEQLKTLVVDEIMNSNVMETLNQTFYSYFTEITSDLNGVNNLLFDQANAIIQTALMSIVEDANTLLQGATGAITAGIPIEAAKVDGYATIVGNELERLHIGSEWTLKGDSEQNSSTFSAALDISSLNANGEAVACSFSGGVSSVLDAVISTQNLPISIAGSNTSIKSLALGFTLRSPAPGTVPVPINVFGEIYIDGSISYEAFELYDIGFEAGVGIDENYIGATADGSFSDIQVEAAFLLGKTCNTDTLLGLDAQAAEFISFPGGVFNGAYARGAASIPIYHNGCALKVGVGADAGAWLLIGSPLTIGGIVGGSAYGEAACIASIRGQVAVFGEKSGDQYMFRGDAFGAAGLGFDCDPGTWTSVRRSRKDDWCGTGDAAFSATAIVTGGGSLSWDVGSPRASAIH